MKQIQIQELKKYKPIIDLLKTRLPEIKKKTQKIVRENNFLKGEMAFTSIEYAKLDDERIVLEKKLKNLLRENDLITEENDNLIKENNNLKQPLIIKTPPPPQPSTPQPISEKLIDTIKTSRSLSLPLSSQATINNFNTQFSHSPLLKQPPPPSTPLKRQIPPPPSTPPPSSLIRPTPPLPPPSTPPPPSLIANIVKTANIKPPEEQLPLNISIECLDCNTDTLTDIDDKDDYSYDSINKLYKKINTSAIYKPKFKFNTNIKKWQIFINDELFANSDISEFIITKNKKWTTTTGENFNLNITIIDKKLQPQTFSKPRSYRGGKRRKTNKRRKRTNKRRRTHKR